MEKNEVLGMVGKRIIVVAKEKLEEISASFVESGYSGVSGYSGSPGIYGVSGVSGRSGTGGRSDDKFALTLKKVRLIAFDDYLLQEVTDDCVFIRVAKIGNYNDWNKPSYGTWYTAENFFDAFDILKVLNYKPEKEK
jgi:hypothetical protein